MDTRLKRSWRCEVCSCIHIGQDLPVKCPKCKASHNLVEAVPHGAWAALSDEGLVRMDLFAAKEAGG